MNAQLTVVAGRALRFELSALAELRPLKNNTEVGFEVRKEAKKRTSCSKN